MTEIPAPLPRPIEPSNPPTPNDQRPPMPIPTPNLPRPEAAAASVADADGSSDAAAAAAAAAADAAAAAPPMPAMPAMPVMHAHPPTDAACNFIDCPPGLVGRVIGKGGETIKGLQAQSGAHITIDQNYPDGAPRKISISGPAGCVDIASKLVEDLLKGGPVRGGGVGPGQAQQIVECPKDMVGRVIGRGGETIKGLQSQTGARIQIDQSVSPCLVTITGNPYCVDAASRAVVDVINGGSTAPYSAANQQAQFAAAAGMYGQQHAGGNAAYQAAAYAQQMGAYADPRMYGGYGAQMHPAQMQQYAQHQQAMMLAMQQAQAQAQQQQQQQQQQARGGDGSDEAAAAPRQPAGAFPGHVPGGVPVPGGPGGEDAASGDGDGTPGGGAPGSGSEWQPLDDGRGRTYYYNTVTGASQWVKPV